MDVPDVEVLDVDVPDVVTSDDEPEVDLSSTESVPTFDALVADEPDAVEPGVVESGAIESEIVEDGIVEEGGELTISMPAIDEPETDDTDLSAMPPPSVTPSVLASMAPPAMPQSVLDDLSGASRKTADDVELDPRAQKAFSRQERKDAKAAIRREAKEARESARRARAAAKAEAKADLTDESVLDEPVVDEAVEATEALIEAPADMPPPVVAPPAVTPVVAESPADMAPPTPRPSSSATDPRSRAAARVQRRLGRDAEKVSAAETRARAREEARRRRVQAKELRSGTAVAEAAEAVVRMPDEHPDVTAEIPAINDPATQLIQPIEDTPVVHDELVIDEPVVEDVVVDELVEDAVEDPDPTTEASDEALDEDGFEGIEELEDPEAEAAEFTAPALDDPLFDESAFDEPTFDEATSTSPVPDEMPAPVVTPRATEKPAAPKWTPDEVDEPSKKSGLGPIAGVVGLVALAISVLLAVSALAVALGVDSGGVYNALQAIADTLVGPLKSAFDFSGSNAERKEHFLAWGAGSLGYLVLSFIGQAVQRANSDDE